MHTKSESSDFPLSQQFGATIQARRKEMGLKQQDLAFAVGVNRRVIGRLERGIGTVRIETALRALRELGLTIEILPRS